MYCVPQNEVSTSVNEGEAFTVTLMLSAVVQPVSVSSTFTLYVPVAAAEIDMVESSVFHMYEYGPAGATSVIGPFALQNVVSLPRFATGDALYVTAMVSAE